MDSLRARAPARVAILATLVCACAVSGGCKKPPAPPAGGGSTGSAKTAPAGSDGSGGPVEPRRVVLEPPRGVDLSTPASTHKAAREFIRDGQLTKLFQLGFPQDLAQFASTLDIVIGAGLREIRNEDPALAHRLFVRYTALVNEHGVDYAKKAEGIEALYRHADLPALLTDMLAFTSALPFKRSLTEQMKDSVDEELGPVEYEGDDARARQGERWVYFHRVEGAWLLRFGQPPDTGRGS